jgi:hypothetical protein
MKERKKIQATPTRYVIGIPGEETDGPYLFRSSATVEIVDEAAGPFLLLSVTNDGEYPENTLPIDLTEIDAFCNALKSIASQVIGEPTNE